MTRAPIAEAYCSFAVFLVLMLVLADGAGLAEQRMPEPAAQGREVYVMYCTSCHGTQGDGNGPIAPGLNPRPTDFSDPKTMGTITDKELTSFITEGGGPAHNCPTMPSWAPILRDEDVAGVVAYIRSLQRK